MKSYCDSCIQFQLLIYSFLWWSLAFGCAINVKKCIHTHLHFRRCVDQFADICIQCNLSGEVLVWYGQTETPDRGVPPIKSKLQDRIVYRQEKQYATLYTFIKNEASFPENWQTYVRGYRGVRSVQRILRSGKNLILAVLFVYKLMQRGNLQVCESYNRQHSWKCQSAKLLRIPASWNKNDHPWNRLMLN